MGSRVTSDIENEFARLSPEAQLTLLERLVHRARLAVAGHAETWDQDLASMAADPEVRHELALIDSEFAAAEGDGM